MYRLLVIVALASLLLLAASPIQARSPADTIYIVQPGDTLYRVALRFGVTVQAIAQANQLPNPNLIYVGQQLIIPGVAGTPPAPTASPRPLSPTPLPGVTPSPGAAGIYFVQRGDTLWAIAQRYGTTVSGLMSLNGLTAWVIYPGQTLLIPGAAQPIATPTPWVPPVAGRIVSFEISVSRADAGDPVALAWEAVGERATLCALQPHGLPWPGTCTDVPLTGTYHTLVSTQQRYYARYSLSVVPGWAPGQPAYAEVSVPIPCPDTWALSSSAPPGVGGWNCPAGRPVTTSGAAERFERGVMYWVAGPNVILVRGPAYGQAQVVNLWTENVPDSDPTLVPPAGLYQPVRGFGYTWRGFSNLGDLRGTLGWALEPEYATSFTYQCNSAPEAKLEYCYLQTPHGLTLWHGLGWGVWHQVRS